MSEKKGNIPRGSATEGGREELTLDPNVSTRDKRKDEEEPNEQERFEVVGRDRLGREDHSPDQLSLTSAKSGAENDSEATTVGRRERVRRVCNAGRLEDLGTTEEDRVAVDAVDIETVRARTEFDRFLQERGRLAGEHGLVDDGGSAKQKEVARDARVFFGADCECFQISDMDLRRLKTQDGRDCAETARTLTDADEVTGEELVGLDLDPLVFAPNKDVVRLDRHAPKLADGAQALEDGRALKDDEHEQGEDRVPDVLVEEPQEPAKDLEDEEGGDGVLAEELDKGRDGDVEHVLAKVGAGSLDVLGRRQTLGGLEGRERRRCVARVRDAGKSLGGRVEKVLVALVREEDEVVLALAL